MLGRKALSEDVLGPIYWGFCAFYRPNSRGSLSVEGSRYFEAILVRCILQLAFQAVFNSFKSATVYIGTVVIRVLPLRS